MDDFVEKGKRDGSVEEAIKNSSVWRGPLKRESKVASEISNHRSNYGKRFGNHAENIIDVGRYAAYRGPQEHEACLGIRFGRKRLCEYLIHVQ